MSEKQNSVESEQSWKRPVRRALGIAAIGGCVFGGAAAYSLTHASVNDSFGPHEATYSLNTSGEVVANFGPLGTLRHDSDRLLPSMASIFNIGATVNIGEIPEGAPIGNGTDSIVGLFSNDAQTYVQFFTHPEVTIDTVTNKLVTNIVQHTLLYGSEVSLGLTAGYLALGKRRRQEMTEVIKKNNRKEIATIGVLSLALTGCIVNDSPQYRIKANESQASTIFDGTILNGSRVTGRLGELINTYGNKIIDYVHENNSYYGDIAKNVEQALKYYTVPGDNPDIYTTALVVSDLHCNIGMAEAIHATLLKTGADMYLDTGDTVMSGTSVEGYCINTFAAAVPKGVKKVVSPGNHDSVLTRQQEADDNFIVLNGEPVTVENVTILGDNDPYLNVIGQPVEHITKESIEELGTRIANVACDQNEPIDILMIHRPAAAQESLARGCVNLALSGHMHTESMPTILSNGSIGYTSGTSGGATEEMPTIGAKLGTDSKMSVWLFDKKTGKPAFTRTLTVELNGSATASNWINLQPTLPGITPSY